MNLDYFHKINGYLAALSNISCFFGPGYGHKYCFTHFQCNLEESFFNFMKTSEIRYHDLEIIGHEKVDKWEVELFTVASSWFFQFLDTEGMDCIYPNGEKVPTVQIRDKNTVANSLVEFLNHFFADKTISVYRLKLSPEYTDEFTWDQYFFETDHGIFVLSYYQWG